MHGQGYADLGFLVPETVAGVTSRKGPFDLEQGWFATAGAVGYELGTTNRHRLVAVDAPVGGPSGQFVAAEIMHDDGYGRGRGTERGSAIAQTELRAGRLVLRPMVVGYWSKFGEPGVIPVDEIASGYFGRMDAPAGDLGGRSQRLLAGLGTSWARGGDEVVASAHVGWRGLSLDENFTGFLESELGDGRRQTHRAVTGGVRIAWRRKLAPWLRLLTGTELIRDQLMQTERRVSTTGMVYRDERELAAATSSGGAWAGLEARRGRWIATGGEVTGELPGEFILSWTGQPQPKLGDGTLLVGDYRGANFAFRVAGARDNLAAGDPLLGHAFHVTGTIAMAGTTKPFDAVLDVEPGAQVIGAVFEDTVTEASTETLAIEFFPTDPNELDTPFDGVDFFTLPTTASGTIEIRPGSAAHNIIRRSIQTHDHYGVLPQ